MEALNSNAEDCERLCSQVAALLDQALALLAFWDICYLADGLVLGLGYTVGHIAEPDGGSYDCSVICGTAVIITTSVPSLSPSSLAPTLLPLVLASGNPTATPSLEPSAAPLNLGDTNAPTSTPTPSPTLLPVTPVPTDTPSMFPTPRPSMAIELNFASLAPRRVFRAYVDIWFVVVPDQTISGLAFRDNDVEQFRQDVSDAYGTMLDRLQLLSLQQTSVAGTKRMRHGSRECPDCSPFSIRSCVSHAPPRFRNVCSPLCSLL